MRLYPLFVLALFPLASAHARDTFVRQPLNVISMYTPQIYQAWKASRKIQDTCTKNVSASDKVFCRKEMQKERVWKLNVYEGPSASSELKGVMELGISGAKGLDLRYTRNGAKKPQRFKPTFHCKFIESDCIGEQSILDRKGDWIQLPQGPMIGHGWINFKQDLGAEPRVRVGIGEGRSYILDRTVRATKQATGKNQFLHQGEEIFVKKMENSNLIVRRRQKGDEKCKPPQFELGKEPPEYAIHFSELYDGRGQMKIHPAYADFCPKSDEVGRDLKL